MIQENEVHNDSATPFPMGTDGACSTGRGLGNCPLLPSLSQHPRFYLSIGMIKAATAIPLVNKPQRCCLWNNFTSRAQGW